jgi:hypothetical protein
VAVGAVGVVLREPEIERGQLRDRARHADSAVVLERRRQCGTNVFGTGVELDPRGRVGAQEALGQPDRAEVEADMEAVGDELARASADVDDEGLRLHFAARGRAAEREQPFLLAGQEPRFEAVAPLDLAQKRLTVLGVPDRARADGECALCAELLDQPPVVRKAVAHARNREGEQAPALVDAVAELREAQVARNLGDATVLDVGHEQPGGVGPEIDGCDAHGKPR